MVIQFPWQGSENCVCLLPGHLRYRRSPEFNEVASHLRPDRPDPTDSGRLDRRRPSRWRTNRRTPAANNCCLQALCTAIASAIGKLGSWLRKSRKDRLIGGDFLEGVLTDGNDLAVNDVTSPRQGYAVQLKDLGPGKCFGFRRGFAASSADRPCFEYKCFIGAV